MAKNKFEYYDEMKEHLEEGGYTVGEYREINYGLQFDIVREDKKSVMRIYESKKGLRPDTSQIKDGELLQYITGESRGKIRDDNGADPAELIGTDESGKGDYFGPLVIAGVYVNEENARKLKAMGADDSKRLTDKQIAKLAESIKKVCPYSVVVIGNEKYNELYEKIKNLNKLLAWGHARVIENVLSKVDCKYVLSDQFGDENLIKNALMEKGKTITLFQRPRAEENTAVAAASILARDEFVSRIKQLEEAFQMEFPKGASAMTVEAARKFVETYEREKLSLVSKLHFKTTGQI
ncbi:ribonuclease HIII [Oxobacter pfennigii]|uniref:Ribonuclease n=1 Tax=Oxobacter pfennigii TaxID=36849 RepID=A0A0P8WEP8_9CLOT|nr:ribonuclease HIII [Oxobacter pfennigii]KPU46226.1 ribonuclease HIII [Oxobacter pfennigii]